VALGLLGAAALAALHSVGSAQVHWDIDGATPGAGGATPSGAWDLTTANWSNSSNGDVVPQLFVANDTAVFSAGTDATGSFTVTVPAGLTIPSVNGIIFEEGSVTVAAGDAASAINLLGSTVTVTGTHTINPVLTGTNGFTKEGTGTLFLGGLNTFTGQINMNRGRVWISNPAALGSPTNAIVNAGTTNIQLALTGGITIPNPITLTNGPGTFAGPAQIDSQSGNNTWSGQITLQGGSNNTEPGLININAALGSTLTITGQMIGSGASQTFAKTGAGTLVIANAVPNTYAGLTRHFGGTIVFSADGAFGTAGGGIFQVAVASTNLPQTIVMQPTGGGFSYGTELISMSGISPSADVGLFHVPSGDNTWAGTISMANTFPLATPHIVQPSAITVAGGATLNLTSNVVNSSATNHRMLFKGGQGQVNLTGFGTFSGPTQVANGTLSFAGPDGRDEPVGAGTLQATFDVYPGAGIKFDNTDGARNDRIVQTAGQTDGLPVRLFGAGFSLVGNGTTAVNTTNVGGLLKVYGSSSITLSDNGAGTQFAPGNKIARQTNASVLYRGANLGTAGPGPGINTVVHTEAAFNTISGGTSGAGTPGVGILPFDIGDASVTGSGTDFVTYDGTNGVRLLTAAEYNTGAIDGLGGPNFQNVSVSTPQVINSTTAVNAIRFTAAGANITNNATLTVNSGAILNASGSPISIGSPGTLVFGSTPGVIHAIGGGDVTINDAIIGTGGLIKNGSANLTLTNSANSYGPTTINAGTLIVTANAQLGTEDANTLTINGGYLKPGAAVTSLSRPVVVSSRFGGFDVGAGQTLTLAGDVSGEGRIVKTGAGELVLSGNNSQVHGVAMLQGTLTVGSNSNLGPDSLPVGAEVHNAAALYFNGGTLRFTGGFDLIFNRHIELDSGGGTISVDAGQTVNNNTFMWSRGGFTKTGDGTLVMGTTNPRTTFNQYLGTTKLLGGTTKYEINASGFVGLANVPRDLVSDYFFIDNGATLIVNGNSTANSNFGQAQRGITMGAGGGVLEVPDPFTWTMNAPLAGTGTLTKQGNGTLSLVSLQSAANFSGNVVVAAGTLVTNADGRFGAVPGAPTAGKIVIQDNAALASNPASTNVTINANRGITLAGGNATISVNNGGGTMSYAGTIAGGGILNKRGGGTLNLSGSNNTFSAGMIIQEGNVLVSQDANLGGAGPVSLSGGTLVVGADFVGSHNLDVNQGDSALDTQTFNATFGTVTTTNNSSLKKYGSGTATIKHIRAGGLNVDAGTVQVGLSGTPNDTTATSVVGTLNINGGPSTPNATLDLTNNSMIIDHNDGPGAQESDMRQLLFAGLSGNGLKSTSATLTRGLGYADNASLSPVKGSFAGQTVDPSSMLIKFTFLGDLDLDGDVDVGDLGELATNWQQNGVWRQGDTDYDGVIGVNDLGNLATNWQQGIITPPLGSSFAEAAAAFGLPSAAVPEPASMGLLALGASALLGRRRRS
jgi:autotransporter-associated beta strand protein